jgi:dolichyl-phosphate beta-glucosyltransferase
LSGPAPELSIIIPAYNEEKRLGRTLQRICEYFAESGVQQRDIEIIVVDDGSTDRTADLTREFTQRMPMPNLRLVSNGTNRGKGYSVRRGMLEARGRIALFTDADLSAPIEESQKLLAALDAGNQIAIGSRAVDRNLIDVHQSAFREGAGIIFNAFVKLFTGLPFEDTQCGFKAFLREPSRTVFEKQMTEGFGFDPEILFLARRQGLQIAEVPVRWSHDDATRVHVVRDSLRMFGDLIFIRWNWLLGRYRTRAESSR